MRLATLVLALLFGPSAALAQPEPGNPAPELHIEKTLGYDGPTTLAELRGRAVVVELWATWCLPCIPALDHLAEVAQEVAGEPITFLAVTDEPEADVQRFLDLRPTPLPVALDADGSVFQDYRPGARPQTLLIDPDGGLAARTTPSRVTADVLRQLLTGAPLPDLAVAPVRPPPNDDEDEISGSALAYDGLRRDDLDALDAETAFKAILVPYRGPGGGGLSIYDRADRPFAYRRVTSRAMPTALVRWAMNAFSIRLDATPGALPDALWFADVIVPAREAEPTMAALRAETVHLVERTFGVAVSREVRPTDVYRLERLDGEPHGFASAEARGTIDLRGSSVSAEGRPFDEFVFYLSQNVDRPIVDATGIESSPFALYDFEMAFVHDVEGDLERELAKLGLRLVAQDGRALDTLVIRPAR